MYKDDVGYTDMRLRDTFVRMKNDNSIVMVRAVTQGDNELLVHIQKKGKRKLETVKMEDLILESPELGNTKVGNDVYYICRQPKRDDWRQGLRAENVVVMWRGKKYYNIFDDLSVLQDTVQNKYPSFKDALMEKGEVAVSREFSLDKEKRIWYKQRHLVGHMLMNAPVLDNKFKWLKESLDDVVNKDRG